MSTKITKFTESTNTDIVSIKNIIILKYRQEKKLLLIQHLIPSIYQ